MTRIPSNSRLTTPANEANEPTTTRGPAAAQGVMPGDGRRALASVNVAPQSGALPGLEPRAASVVRFDAKGPVVKRVQELLVEHGLLTGGLDGHFGPATEAAVKVLQARFDLTADGIVGRKTWQALRASPDTPWGVGKARRWRASMNYGRSSGDLAEVMRVTRANESRDFGSINPRDEDSGVSYGRYQFNQGEGVLGKLFGRFHDADPERFVRLTFGDGLPTGDVPLLRQGSTGDNVDGLHRSLYGIADPQTGRPFTGETTKRGNKEVPTFGPVTRRVVREFQRQNALTVDGAVGNRTWAALGDRATENAEALISQLSSKATAMSGSLARQLMWGKASKLRAGKTVWGERLRALGEVEPFQAIQTNMAVAQYMRPAILAAEKRGFQSERALALFFDLCIQHGPYGGPSIVKGVVEANPKTHRRMLQASGDERAALEHDLLVAVVEASIIRRPADARPSQTRRRMKFLTDAKLSDRPALVLDPGAPEYWRNHL